MYSTLVSWRDVISDYVHSTIGKSESKRKRFQYAAIGSLSIISISCLIQYVRLQKRNKANKALDPYFSSTYHSARDKFREAASNIDAAQQHAIVIDTECDLCTVQKVDVTLLYIERRGVL